MRRAVGFIVLSGLAAAVLVAASAGPASAHLCPGAALAPVGQPHTIQVLVRIEQHPVSDVTISLPSGLQLDRVDPKVDWTATRNGSTIRYRGGPFSAFTCQYFPMGITAPAKGTFPVRVVTRDPAGAVAIDSASDPKVQSDPNFSSVVYAGTSPPAPPGSGGGVSFVTVAIGVVGAIALVLVGTLGFRAWRKRGLDDDDDDDDGDTGDDERDEDARAAELRARVDEFKKRTPGRPAPD